MKTFLCYLFLATCVLVILLQGLHPVWNGHLITDLFVFKERSVGNFVNNEYQPGALFFFNLLSPFALNQSLDTFKNSLFGVNILLVFLIGWLIQKITRPVNVILLGFIILFIGPILLFRFELLVVFLVIASFYFFKRNLHDISPIILGLATMVKVYPIIYLPYFIISLYKEKKIKEAIIYFLIFIYTCGIFLILFINFYNFSPIQLIDSLRYHELKPIGLEGFWSAIISLSHLLSTGSPPNIISAYVSWGISPDNLYLPMWFFNNFWLLILGLLYLQYLRQSEHKKLNEAFLLIITLTTILFSKFSSPQYLIWFVFLIPLINIEKFISNSRICLILIISLIVAFLTQYIYPLNYSEFLSFFNKGTPLSLFYLFVVKNLLLLIIFYLLLSLKNE